MLDLNTLNWEKGTGLVTVVAQDARSGAVLMVAHADRIAIERTIETGEMHYYSRSRGRWHKGATSGNRQRLVSLSADCDGDAVLARIIPMGPACHRGTTTCFGVPALAADALGEVEAMIVRRAAALQADEPAMASFAQPVRPSYTQRLLRDRNLRLKKLGEEVAELLVACADGDVTQVMDESADLLYHLLVALYAAGVSLQDVQQVLLRRRIPCERGADEEH